jgi:cytochrome P450
VTRSAETRLLRRLAVDPFTYKLYVHVVRAEAGSRDHEVDRLVERFDHHDPAFANEGSPRRVYQQLRETCPVAHTEASGGYWVASRYRDVDRVAKDPAMFSSALGITIPDLTDGLDLADADAMLAAGRGLAIPPTFDPPAHAPYRRLLNAPFSPGSVAAREDSVRAIADAE